MHCCQQSLQQPNLVQLECELHGWSERAKVDSKALLQILLEAGYAMHSTHKSEHIVAFVAWTRASTILL